MTRDDANESLLTLIGELLYKNQLLREAVTSKDEAIDLIAKHLMSASTSACSCRVGTQVTFVLDKLKEQDIEFARQRGYCLNEFCHSVKYPVGFAATPPSDVSFRTAEEYRLIPMDSTVSRRERISEHNG